MAFTHLHVHTEYSLLDGSSKIKEIVVQAKKLGMDSLAITDHGVMYGVIDFYRAARNAGIKPILGSEVYVAPGSRFDRETVKGEDRYYHLILLAENNLGYSNLTKIVSKGFIDGYYYKPRVDMEVLQKYHEGVICLSACLAGEVQRFLARNSYDEAKEVALKYQKIFGPDNFFLELQDHGIPEQKLVNRGLLRIHEETGINLVATNDVHYTYEEDAAAHDILICIQTAKKVADEDRMRYEGGQYYLKSEEEMRALFPYAQEAIDNTHMISERCNVEIEFGVTKLPLYECPDGYEAYDYLTKLCEEGLEKRYSEVNEQLKQRLEYELGVIKVMGYVDYFLIVWDYINYAKLHEIAVGPGRGSAAGSIVSYCMGITDIDPIKYQLLFERFLNPERVSMPDIDVDFCFVRRQEVIDYVVRKYGKERVVQIITFGTLAAKGVVRDVGRVLDLPYAKCDAIAKMIPSDLGMTLDKALVQSADLKLAYKTDAEVTNLIDMSRRLEGLPRHSSMHAAGVVISKLSVDEYVPLSRASDGSITTQFTMTTLEELGLLKMDFLGLRTLTVIQNTCKQIEKNHGIVIDTLKMDYNDKSVLDSIGTGKTEGIFQLESAGMQSFMKELKPENLEDIIAGISLYRPGPMEFIPKYLKGKNDKSSITYDCPQLEPILAPTYGCIVYQEQVMQIVRDLAGYTLGRSDLLRRAMSKKKAYVMEKERKNFVYGNQEEGVAGCIANGIPERIASKIYDDMTDFAKYAFNKSHAACYAWISYQTAYLKYYYTKEFMAALMTSVMDQTSKIAEYILTCRMMGIEILPPDINEGESDFTVSGDYIRFGMSAIKSIGTGVIDEIVSERKNHGRYISMEDFIERLSNKEVNRRTLENFIKAGALDSLPGNRRQKVLIAPEMLDRKNKDKKNIMSGQISLFEFAEDEEKDRFRVKFPDVAEFTDDDRLVFEKETLGVYITGHPMQSFEKLWNKTVTNRSVDFYIDEETDTAKVSDGAKCIIGGIIADRTIKTTKTNKSMAFIVIEDLVGSVEVIIFPKDYERYKDIITVDKKVFVQGRVSMGDDPAGKVICERITELEALGKEVWVQYKSRQEYEADKQLLLSDLQDSDGSDDIKIYCKLERIAKTLPANLRVHADDSLLNKLKQRLGKDNVKVVTKVLK